MKKISIVLLISLMAFLTFACTTNEANVGNEIEKEQVSVSQEKKESVRVVSLKGPTSMGLVKFIDDEQKKEDSPYDFQIVTMADEIVSGISAGEIDIATIPANLASVLYNKTGGEVKVAAINTLGVLYIVENGEAINDFEDLKGKIIYTTGKGQSPEHVLNYVLTQNGLNPDEDVTIEFKSEASEVAAILASEDDVIAMLPEPFITTAMMKNDDIRAVFDMTKEWDKLQENNDSSLVTGVLIVRNEFLENNKETFNEFLSQYKDSIEFTNNNIDEAAKLIGEYEIVDEEIAKTAIPKCNIAYMEGSELVHSLKGYLDVLHQGNADSIGGELPDEEFYYVK